MTDKELCGVCDSSVRSMIIVSAAVERRDSLLSFFVLEGLRKLGSFSIRFRSVWILRELVLLGGAR